MCLGCQNWLFLYVLCTCRPFPVSTSNLTGAMIGSLKKGSKQSLSLPSTAYNTLPSQHHLRTTTSSPRFIQQGPSSSHSHSAASHHKRSPSSDSGHGTMHQTAPNATSVSSGPASGGGGGGFAANVRSTTPVSYHGSTGAGGGGSGGGRRSNNTVYLHGM